MSDSEYAIRPNKTQLKREIRALNELGQELIKLADGNLKKIPLSDSMRVAINDAKRFQRGALQRQLRRIASLMQQEDVEAIKTELLRLKQPDKQQTAEFHMLESWRDRLLEGDEKLLSELIDRFPEIDRQYLRQLMRNGQKERLKQSTPKSARLLFKYLKELKSSETAETKTNDETN